MSFLSNFTEGQKNFGLLIMRIGIGAMMIMHGYPKLIGGPDKWEKIGEAMKYVNMEYYPVVWGFLAGLAETGGGLLLILGILFRPACFFLLFTMVMAVVTHFGRGDEFMRASHAIELAFVFFGLFFIGPGNFRLRKMVIE